MSNISNNNPSFSDPPAIIAMAQQQDRFKAVAIRKTCHGFEVLRTGSNISLSDGPLLIAECDAGETMKVAAVGFDSTAAVFFQLKAPPLESKELAAMVRFQAESRLPIPPEQIELGLRTEPTQDGQMIVTVAAAKNGPMQKFVETVLPVRPGKILLNCEALVKSWRTYFAGRDDTAVIVSIDANDTRICLAKGGRLSNAMSLDVGINDCSANINPGETEALDRLTQDIISVLDLFGSSELLRLPVFVLSDGGEAITQIVSCFVSKGLDAQVALPQTQNLSPATKLTIQDAYEYRVPIGLGLMALAPDEGKINLFERLYNPAENKQKKYWWHCPKAAAIITALMLLLAGTVFYQADASQLRSIQKHLDEAQTQAGVNFLQQQKLLKTVAAQRLDMLDLLNEINETENNGIIMDTLRFNKGQTIQITGQVPAAEELYKFQKELQNKKGVSDVKIEILARDKDENKDKKLPFKITFHYKDFTRK